MKLYYLMSITDRDRAEDMAADVGTILYGEEAVSCGLIDQLGGLPEGLDWLYRKMEEKL